MSKYYAVWDYISKSNKSSLILSYEDIEKIAGIPIDHSFLTYKKELLEYGYKVKKISIKNQTVAFEKVNGNE